MTSIYGEIKMKALWYCPMPKKANEYLIKGSDGKYFCSFPFENADALNGKVVAISDYDVEKIYFTGVQYVTKTLLERELKERSRQSLDGQPKYAIHIRDLYIFKMNVKLDELLKCPKPTSLWIEKEPRNMTICYSGFASERINIYEKCVLIPVKPEQLASILNGTKTTELRKRILKDMK